MQNLTSVFVCDPKNNSPAERKEFLTSVMEILTPLEKKVQVVHARVRPMQRPMLSSRARLVRPHRLSKTPGDPVTLLTQAFLLRTTHLAHTNISIANHSPCSQEFVEHIYKDPLTFKLLTEKLFVYTLNEDTAKRVPEILAFPQSVRGEGGRKGGLMAVK